MHFHFPHHHHQCLIIIITIMAFPLCFCDPRITDPFLFCSSSKSKASNFVPTFVKGMETLSKLITTAHHFATFNLSIRSSSNHMYGMAQCHHDLSRTDCLLCFASSRTKLPRCLPSLSAAIFLDGCFLRYDSYSFYRESLSPSLDAVKCSPQNATAVSVSDYGSRSVIEFGESVKYAVGNASRIAVARGGFGAAKAMGVYALAQCWDSVGRDGCEECLEKAGKGVRENCLMKKEGRGVNAGCYLRYSTDKFFNHDTGDDDDDDDHGK